MSSVNTIAAHRPAAPAPKPGRAQSAASPRPAAFANALGASRAAADGTEPAARPSAQAGGVRDTKARAGENRGKVADAQDGNTAADAAEQGADPSTPVPGANLDAASAAAGKAARRSKSGSTAGDDASDETASAAGKPDQPSVDGSDETAAPTTSADSGASRRSHVDTTGDAAAMVVGAGTDPSQLPAIDSVHGDGKTAADATGTTIVDSATNGVAAHDAARAASVAPLADMDQSAKGGATAATNAPSASDATAATPWNSAGVSADGLKDQIGASLVNLVSSSRRELVVRLKPPELGQLMVRVAVNGRDVSAWFESAQPQVQQAITQAIGQLHTDLGNAGFNLSGAWVGADGSSGGARERVVASPSQPRASVARLSSSVVSPGAQSAAPGGAMSIYV
jgi:flagellar hook-length control protein FliK